MLTGAEALRVPRHAARLRPSSAPSHWWSIILAGGSGERLRGWVHEQFGERRPKQYCTLVGSRSMLQHTIDRADAITVSDQRVTVVASDHRLEATRQLRHRAGHLVAQPGNCDTAAGIFLPLSFVRAMAPDATVVVYPSDHFVDPEGPFIDVVRRALAAADRLRDRVVLVGVSPDRPDADYGWITRGAVIDTSSGLPVHAVSRFAEKPGTAAAEAARQAGALWNTFVFAAKADVLWNLGRRCVPAVVDALDPVGRAMGTADEAAALAHAYQAMPCLNFSRDVLERSPESAAVIELVATHWSDWGRPERIAHSLGRLGRRWKRESGGTRVASCS